MSRHGRQDALRQQMMARWERSSPDERGKLVVLLWCNATMAVLIDGSLVLVAATSARRIWRLRSLGWVQATTQGTAWKSITSLALASVARQLALRTTLRQLTTPEPEPRP